MIPYPFPVPLAVYDQTIRVLKTAVANARLGREGEFAALKRPDDQARQLGGYAIGPAFRQVLEQERRENRRDV
jgi:uncharacterized protein